MFILCAWFHVECSAILSGSRGIFCGSVEIIFFHQRGNSFYQRGKFWHIWSSSSSSRSEGKFFGVSSEFILQSFRSIHGQHCLVQFPAFILSLQSSKWIQDILHWSDYCNPQEGALPVLKVAAPALGLTFMLKDEFITIESIVYLFAGHSHFWVIHLSVEGRISLHLQTCIMLQEGCSFWVILHMVLLFQVIICWR